MPANRRGKSAPQSRLNLNLLYPQGITPKLPARFIKWLLNYGRFIVVIVEVIVLSCFVMRFKLDEDLNNQKKEINSRVPFLDSQALSETLSSQTQLRLKLISKVYAESEKNSLLLKKISSQTPLSVTIQNINLNILDGAEGIEFKITSKTANNYDVAVFLNGLKGDKELSEVNLTSISFDSGTLDFTITGKLK